MSLSVGETFAGYTIVRLVGSGGMGEVYLARHPRLPREDALKILRPELSSDEEFRQRFIREADLASALKHPNIVTVHDRGEYDGQLWIATEYVEGTDAAQLMVAKYPVGMPIEEVAAIIAPIASSLDYAHGKGLLHRDVKPANVLLSQPDHTGHRRVFLADFGIARPMADPNGLTATNLTLGTVAYSAPEQLMGEPVDGRADEYALAATAFHLLTGGPMYEASNPVAVISKHLNTPPPAVSGRRSDLEALDDVFATALAKNPGDRFPTCQHFASAISDRAGLSSISGDTTQYGLLAPPPPKPRRKSLSRAVLTTAAPALAVALAGVTIYFIGNGKPHGVAGPTLNGTYRLVYDMTKLTSNGAPIAQPPSDKPLVRTWAFRSSCTSSGCVATGTKLDSDNPSALASPPSTSVLHFSDGRWQETSTTPARVEVPSNRCLSADGTIAAGADMSTSTRSLEPQLDGTLRGVLTMTRLTGNCGSRGGVEQNPFVATRVGDVPNGVNLPDPATVPIAPPITTRTTDASDPALNGIYRWDFSGEVTLNDAPRTISAPDTQWWAFRSVCTPVKCVATAASISPVNKAQPVGGSKVLEFNSGQWQETPSISGPVSCPEPDSALSVITSTSVSIEPQAEGVLRGTLTIRYLTDVCGSHQGDVFKVPMVATRIGDVPPAVVLADPALFM